MRIIQFLIRIFSNRNADTVPNRQPYARCRRVCVYERNNYRFTPRGREGTTLSDTAYLGLIVGGGVVGRGPARAHPPNTSVGIAFHIRGIRDDAARATPLFVMCNPVMNLRGSAI
ncbi:hypothetical protein EVAR_47776_1 [Eumeta japonica]|uniref:Uncharacterized protein n=1 Tax=Eumeta variegata TaxID=151549 RepID=A0A4C1XYD1_EUMVA|nr:hypothetical protein EVAR_47776_1 [Eumeta japonica]